MTYSEFVSFFFNGMTQCTRWLKSHMLASDDNPIFSEHLIFTILAISIFLLLIEEILGLITSFRFGGFLFRRFGHSYGSGYRTRYETEYPKAYDVEYSSDFRSKPFRSGYRSKYLIYYDGSYYPFRHSRYNPFYFREFNSAYREGRIVSSSQLSSQKIGNVNSSSFSGYNNFAGAGGAGAGNYKGMSGNFAMSLGQKLGKLFGKKGKQAYKFGSDINDLMNGNHDPYTSGAFMDDNFGSEESLGDVLQSAYDKVDRSNLPYHSEQDKWLKEHPDDWDLAEYNYNKAMEDGDAFDTKDE